MEESNDKQEHSKGANNQLRLKNIQKYYTAEHNHVEWIIKK